MMTTTKAARKVQLGEQVMNALASCAVEANNQAESSDFARGVRYMIETLASAAYEGGNWGLSNRLLEIRDSIDRRHLAVAPEPLAIAERLVRQHGTRTAEYILSTALKRVCGIPAGVTAISQMLILDEECRMDQQNTSALAFQAAEARGER
jgi:hypothetical protein